MSEERFTPREQALIERLQHAPQKQLSPRIGQAIHEKMLAEFANPALSGAASTGATVALPPALITVVLVSLATLTVIVGVLIGRPAQEEAPTDPAITLSVAAPTMLPDATTAPATETHTPEPTFTFTATVSATATMTASATPTSSATAVPSDTPSATATPSATPTPELVRITIEGVIQIIEADSIIVHDVRIELSPEQLSGLRVGDTIRVEGETDLKAQIIVIHAISVVRVELPTPASQGSSSGSTPGSSDSEQFDCNNPPPPWAPAQGWRARCEGGAAPGNSGNRGRP